MSVKLHKVIYLMVTRYWKFYTCSKTAPLQDNNIQYWQRSRYVLFTFIFDFFWYTSKHTSQWMTYIPYTFFVRALCVSYYIIMYWIVIFIERMCDFLPETQPPCWFIDLVIWITYGRQFKIQRVVSDVKGSDNTACPTITNKI